MRNKNPQYRVKSHDFLTERLIFARADRKDREYNWWMALTTSWAALLHQSRHFKGYMHGQSRFERNFTPLGARGKY